MLPVLSFVSLVFVCNINAGNLPEYIQRCDLEDKNFVECVKEKISTTLPYFTKGIKELDVPPLDPVKLDDIDINGNGLNLSFTDANMYGISNAVITNLKLDIGKDDETFSLQFKSNMTLMAKYVINGRILILPIQGKGDAKVKANNVEVQIDSKLSHVKDKAGTHFRLVTPIYKYNIEKTTFQFDNLFNGNKRLSDTTHEFANQNWRQLMDDLSPPYIKQIVKTCVKAINKFFAKFTIQEMVKNYKEN
ncbi:protein takeout-like [Hyposmocoma kahamanoa]|uniref:protein takeout-like n=1 Tax=Hyposmocoma kahamanoa TaxID=1477025 RepID=UPI000E6D7541|nr:protein takeout-like [Hyposmocoma kahamanoa]